MSRGSSIDGMAGMDLVSRRIPYPHIRIVRPLLECHKKQLIAVCSEARLEWVEDATNSVPNCARNCIRLMLREEQPLLQGLNHLHTTFSHIRAAINKEGEVPYA